MKVLEQIDKFHPLLTKQKKLSFETMELHNQIICIDFVLSKGTDCAFYQRLLAPCFSLERGVLVLRISRPVSLLLLLL